MAKQSDNPKSDIDIRKLSFSIGDRFRYARELCPLNRTDFCNKYDLNLYTVQSWELGRSLSRTTNVLKFIEALATEGILCSEAWLMEGIGPIPSLASSPGGGNFAPPITPRQLYKKSNNLYESLVQKEIALFCDHSLKMGMDGVVIQISDDAMSPDYEVGEFIGAWRVRQDQINHFHFVVCLVETIHNHFLVRRLLREQDSYILMALNQEVPLIRLDQVKSVAEIIWRRRIKTQFANEII
jgi:hypothetical protein